MTAKTFDLPVIVLCAGGHARVIIDAISRMGLRMLGVVDTDPVLKGMNILGLSVLGQEDVLDSYSPGEVWIANGLGGIKSMEPRQKLFEKLKGMGYQFVSVLHPSAVIAENVVLSEGVQIMAGVVIQTGTNVGEDTIINTKASVDHDCRIGKHVHIAPGVTVCGGVTIGENTYIGSGSTIIQGVNIAKDLFVKAGSLVTKNIDNNIVKKGNAGRRIL
jgi:sugar O-acyltransferase (sialic acid O-acetyltransferase NeuD family)